MPCCTSMISKAVEVMPLLSVERPPRWALPRSSLRARAWLPLPLPPRPAHQARTHPCAGRRGGTTGVARTPQPGAAGAPAQHHGPARTEGNCRDHDHAVQAAPGRRRCAAGPGGRRAPRRPGRADGGLRRYGTSMATLDDAARMAAALPEGTEGDSLGNRTRSVGVKSYAWDRTSSNAYIRRLRD